MKAIIAILLSAILGLYAYNTFFKKDGPILDPTKDSVILKDGTIVAGMVIERNGKIAVVIDNGTIARVVKSERPGQQKRQPVKRAPEPDPNICQHCNGTGYLENPCPSCNGTGKTRCNTCFGDGYDYKNCTVCKGTGWCWNFDRDGSKQQVKCHCRDGDPKQNLHIICPDCKGSGQTECKACGGKGSMKVDCPSCVNGRKTR